MRDLFNQSSLSRKKQKFQSGFCAGMSVELWYNSKVLCLVNTTWVSQHQLAPCRVYGGPMVPDDHTIINSRVPVQRFEKSLMYVIILSLDMTSSILGSLKNMNSKVC